MFYIMYLTGLCQRRHWPDPLYECFRTRGGYSCTVRVNNREYTTDTVYQTAELARNAAATRAYMICRNFSVNDGMYPGQSARLASETGGPIQGLPVAIGTGRRGKSYSERAAALAADGEYEVGTYGELDGASGGSSPRSSDSGDSDSRRGSLNKREVCRCGRDYAREYGRCGTCLRDATQAQQWA